MQNSLFDYLSKALEIGFEQAKVAGSYNEGVCREFTSRALVVADASPVLFWRTPLNGASFGITQANLIEIGRDLYFNESQPGSGKMQ